MLIAAAIVVILLFVPALADIGAYGSAAAGAQTAADAAALAAVQELARGGDSGEIQEQAVSYARANGATLSDIVVSEADVTVSVRKPPELVSADILGVTAPVPVRAAKAEIKDVVGADE